MAEFYPRFFSRLLLPLLLLSSLVCHAQYNGNVQGVVSDPAGAAIDGQPSPCATLTPVSPPCRRVLIPVTTVSAVCHPGTMW